MVWCCIISDHITSYGFNSMTDATEKNFEILLYFKDNKIAKCVFTYLVRAFLVLQNLIKKNLISMDWLTMVYIHKTSIREYLKFYQSTKDSEQNVNHKNSCKFYKI